MNQQRKHTLITRAAQASRTPDELARRIDELLDWEQAAEDAQPRAALLDAYEQPISEGVQHDDVSRM